MPAVKVFNIFGGQKPAEEHPSRTPRSDRPPTGPMQKFYRTFSVGPEAQPESKGSSKVTAIAACLQKKISEPVKSTSDNVQKVLSKIKILESGPNCKTDIEDYPVYENVDFKSNNESIIERNFLLDENKGYSSIYENVIVLGKTLEAKFKNRPVPESKLNKALESFDKIISEFSYNTSLPVESNLPKKIFIPPKLQKSKTCSIIESRCILKKTNSDSQTDTKTFKVSRNNSIDKTTSLWNLDDMKEKQLVTPLTPLAPSNEKMPSDRFATYKVSSKNQSRTNGIKAEDLKKLDVKTRILKKTLSNPPSTPVPVVSKTKPAAKKLEKKTSDPKRPKLKTLTDNGSLSTSSCLESKTPKSQMQKAKSVWEIGNECMVSPNLERTRSTTSIAGSPSKIPVIRSQLSNSKFSSTRALFSPTPLDLITVDQARECAPKKKLSLPPKQIDKVDINKLTRQKSQSNIKLDSNRQEKIKKESNEKRNTSSPKTTLKAYAEEINALRVKLHQRKINNRRDFLIGTAETKQNENIPNKIDLTLSPVKSIVKKLELKTALESKSEPTQFVNCKVIPAVHKELCVANTTFHNHLSTLVGRQIKRTESRDDSLIFHNEKLRKLEEKISDTHSDCSDDSGHVSNDAVNDNDPSLENMSPVDEVDCKFDIPKQFVNDLSVDEKIVRPVRPARRGGSGIEVASGTRGNAPKVDEQIMFRGGVVGSLDSRRDAALARVLVRLQARARGLLARRRAQRLRTQHTAARCVQRNVRAFLAVRDWPWWRLLVRVTPLLAVHRTEHRLKQAQEELETLKSKLEKIETERSHFKNETERLETKLSEVGGELTEERASASLATERADAEAAERLRVERDNRELLTNNERLQQASERLELELLHWRSAENGNGEPSDSEGSEADATAGDKYKRRLERASRELQLLRAQLRRQHEDDLEQLVTVKKQLEKKVQDAYEEVEEQRAVAAQWKRKLQKLTNDMADLRSLLDEQTCRNNLLEKRQRKFDAELQAAQEEVKREKAARERIARERDLAVTDKYSIEQNLAEARLELELKEERLAAATRELEENGGGDEISSLRRAKSELERKCRDQEEELDELAGQIQLLESSKLRVEMLLEQQRKESRLEANAKDDEMEETRANAAKKLKMLESQLEAESAERSLLVRERHELERRLLSLEEAARSSAIDQQQTTQRLKRDLKRYRALLRDAQTMLEQKEKDGGGKAQIRQLKNQIEDLELAVRAATKGRQAAEAEAAEAQAALEEAVRARGEAAERAVQAARDAAAARASLDDAEEEAQELLKKYRASTSALCASQAETRAATERADGCSEEARAAKERAAELAARLAAAEAAAASGHGDHARRLDLRNKELESSLELEATARSRLEGQLTRARETLDARATDLVQARQRELVANEELKKITRQLRELKEENSALSGKLAEALRGKSAAEASARGAQAEALAAREEARLAARRVSALQDALQGELSSPHDSRDTDSSDDSYSSDESIGTFLANHKLSPAAVSANGPHLGSQKSASPEGRISRASTSSTRTSATEPPGGA